MAILVIVFVVCLGSGIYVNLKYSASMPKTPDPATGRVVEINLNHGTRVYVTRRESDRARLILNEGAYLAIVSALLMASIQAFWKKSGPIK